MAARKNSTKKDTRKDGRSDAGAGSPAGSSQPADDGAEVAEERTEVVTYAAAIDVAKGFGMVCTRVPGSRPDRKRQKVWRAEATYHSVVALMDHLRSESIQRLVLESTTGYWRIWHYLAEAGGLEVWLVNARDVRHLPGRGKPGYNTPANPQRRTRSKTRQIERLNPGPRRARRLVAALHAVLVSGQHAIGD